MRGARGVGDDALQQLPGVGGLAGFCEHRPCGDVGLLHSDAGEDTGQAGDRATELPEPFGLLRQPCHRGLGDGEAEFTHALGRRLQGCQGLDGGVVGEVFRDVGELDVPAFGRPGQCPVDVGALVHERQELLVGQQDALRHVGTQGVLHDRLPHGGVERRFPVLVPHRWRGHARDVCGPDQQTVGALLLQRGVLEVDEHQAVRPHNRLEERLDDCLLVAAVHHPRRLGLQDAVGVVLGELIERGHPGVTDLLVQRTAVHPAEGDGLERVPGHADGAVAQVVTERGIAAVGVPLDDGVPDRRHEGGPLAQARQSVRVQTSDGSARVFCLEVVLAALADRREQGARGVA